MTPPKWSLRFFRWFFHPDYREDVEGDLIERFEKSVKGKGELKARWIFAKEVLLLFRPGIIASLGSRYKIDQYGMLGNYLKVTIRNLMKRKLFSFINIFGLAVGMAASLVLWKYVQFELNYDKYNINADVLFRITNSIYSNGKQWHVSGYDLGPSMQSEIPEIKTFIRVHPLYGEAVVSLHPKTGEPLIFRETNLQFVDSAFLRVFTFQPIYGNLSDALTNPSSVVLTKSICEKYFGRGIDPTGKKLQISYDYLGEAEFQVTGVIEDVPENSHVSFDFLLSMNNLLNSDEYRGTNSRLENFMTYVELFPDANKEDAEAKMPAFLDKYLGKTHNSSPGPIIKLQPILDIHFADGGSINTVYFLVLLSAFILSIAWINYINLSTARAMERAKEVGVKKVIGVMRSQLIGQFFLEAALINFFGVILAIILAAPLLKGMGEIMDINLYFDFTKPTIWIWLIALFSIGAVVSGIYPAFILSSFRPKDVINGNLEKNASGFSLRKVLVVFQFTASLLLIIGTFTVYRQIQFMQINNKGMNKDQMLIVKGPQVFEQLDFEERLLSLKHELLKISSIRHVATSDAIPGGGYNWATHATRKGASKEEIIPGQNLEVVFVDPDFIKTYGIELKSGKPWNPASASDMHSIIINEACTSFFDLGNAQKALDESMLLEDEGDQITIPILAVSKNQHWYSLKNKDTPLAFYPVKVCAGWYSVLITDHVKESIEQIEKLYHRAFPENPFDYYFHNDFFNKQYKSEQQFSKIFSLFAVLAILIACLGLFGLASFTALQRLKEISIRKVMGASVVSIMSLLSEQFLRLILISAFVALPIAIYAVNTWLENFAFRIKASLDLYVIPLLILMLVALATVSSQIFLGANINPAKALRKMS